MELLRYSATCCRWCPAFLLLVLFSLGAKGGRVGTKKKFDFVSHCGEAALQPDAPFFIPAQAAAGLVHFHCTGSRPPAGTAFSLGGLLTSSSTEQRTPSTCDRYLWDCFSLSRPPLSDCFAAFHFLFLSGLTTACCNRMSFSGNAEMGLELEHSLSVFSLIPWGEYGAN